LESQCPGLEDWPYALFISLETNLIHPKNDIARYWLVVGYVMCARKQRIQQRMKKGMNNHERLKKARKNWMNGRLGRYSRQRDGRKYFWNHTRSFQIWPVGSFDEKCGETWQKVAGQWLHLHSEKAEG
jgi:hypothetical protein